MKLFAASFLIAMNLMLVVGVNLPMAPMPDPVCLNAIAANSRLEGWRLEAHSSPKGSAGTQGSGKNVKSRTGEKTTYQASLESALASMQFMESK